MSALIDYIEVLFNDCYGGFSISKEALERYNTKLLQRDPLAKKVSYCFHFNRHDPILLEVYHEMNGKKCKKGEGFNDKYAKIRIDKIPKIYENHYFIQEYDGLESVDIRYHRYEVEEIKRIANDESLSYEDRIKQIQNFKLEIVYDNPSDTDSE